MTAAPSGPAGTSVVADDTGRGDRSRTRLRPEARREQIVAAAALLFERRDPAEVTFEQIGEAAGVSRALVYNYFGDKGGLLAAVYTRNSADLDLALAQAFRRAGSGQERLRAVIASYLDFATAHAASCRLISWAEASGHPLVTQARRRRYEAVASTWGLDQDAGLVARGVLGLLAGAVLEWIDAPVEDRERTEAVLLALLWSGLSAFPGSGSVRAGPA